MSFLLKSVTAFTNCRVRINLYDEKLMPARLAKLIILEHDPLKPVRNKKKK